MTNYSEVYAGIELDPSPRGSELGLRMLAKACGTTGCPTIYQSDRGTLVVQGYAISAQQAGIDLPEGELLVEIPAGLLTQVADTVN